MFRALKVFFVVICLVLSIQAVVTASSDVDHVKESSVIDPASKFPPTLTPPTAGLNGPVVIPQSTISCERELKKEGGE